MKLPLPEIPHIKVPVKPTPPRAPHGSKKPKRPKRPQRPLICFYLQFKKAPINTAKKSLEQFMGEDIPLRCFLKKMPYLSEVFWAKRKALSVGKHKRAIHYYKASIA